MVIEAYVNGVSTPSIVAKTGTACRRQLTASATEAAWCEEQYPAVSPAGLSWDVTVLPDAWVSWGAQRCVPVSTRRASVAATAQATSVG